MRLHKFNPRVAKLKLKLRQNKEKYIKVSTLVFSVAILVIGILYFAYAKFSTVNKFKPIQTTVGSFSSGDYTLAAYVDGVKSDTIPTSTDGYYPYKITCNNNAISEWAFSDWSIKINSTLTGTKCSVFFISGTGYDYTGAVQTFIAPSDGYYILEIWGAQGATCTTDEGGYGAYTSGIVNLTSGTNLYITIGGTANSTTGGYNGGGNGGSGNSQYGAGGGGATDITTTNRGTLSSFSSYHNEVLLVAAGGGGTGHAETTIGKGGNGGGISGNSGFDGVQQCYNCFNTATGGTQTAAGTTGTAPSYGVGGFGIGGNYYNLSYGGNGGGSGWYGGGGSPRGHGGGGGGSSYIGNSLLLSSTTIIKHMTCYNCTTSTDAATRTNTTTKVSSDPISDYAKSGNGYARITYIGSTLD
jgi:hypothetical protein